MKRERNYNYAFLFYDVGEKRVQKVLSKMLQESGLEFHPLLECGIYVYMWKGHPLA